MAIPKPKSVWKDIKTPKLPIIFMYLAKPDTRFKADGVYGGTLVIDPSVGEQKAFMDTLNKMNQEVFNTNIKKIKKDVEEYKCKKLFKKEYLKVKDAEGEPTGEEQDTGKFLLKFATKRTFTCWGPDPKTGTLTTQQLAKIWQGSTCKVHLTLKEWVDTQKKDIGFVVYFDKLQFIDIVSGNGGASSCPFETEESTTNVPNGEREEEDEDPLGQSEVSETDTQGNDY